MCCYEHANERKVRIFSLVIFHAVCVLLNAHILMQFTQFSFIFLLLTDIKSCLQLVNFKIATLNKIEISSEERTKEGKLFLSIIIFNFETEMKLSRFCFNEQLSACEQSQEFFRSMIPHVC